MTEALVCLVLFFAIGLAAYWAYRSGRSAERAARQERQSDEVAKTRRLLDRLRRDADYARRLRDRFTR